MVGAVPARPPVGGPEDEESRFEEFGNAIDRFPITLWPLVCGLVFRPARESIGRWQPLEGLRIVLRQMRQRLHKQGLRPAMLATASGGSGGIWAHTMAIHGIPGLGLPLALHCGEAMPIQVHTTPRRNGVPTRDASGFPGVLGQGLLT